VMAVLFTATVATRLRKAEGLQRWARYAGVGRPSD
jgi:hypothetical protein